MKSPQFVVFEMGEELQDFRNELVDLVTIAPLVDVWKIQEDLLTVVFQNCEDWDNAMRTYAMYENCKAVMNKYVERDYFDSRVAIWAACTQLGFNLRLKVERHRLAQNGEFHYKFEKFTRAGLIVYSLNWDNTARAA